MEVTTCPYCQKESIAPHPYSPFCNEYHEHAYNAASDRLLSKIAKRLDSDPDFKTNFIKLYKSL